MDIRLRGGGRATRIDDDEPRTLRAAQPVQDARPHHGLGLGHVVADEEHGVTDVEVLVAPRVAIGAEAFL